MPAKELQVPLKRANIDQALVEDVPNEDGKYDSVSIYDVNPLIDR